MNIKRALFLGSQLNNIHENIKPLFFSKSRGFFITVISLEREPREETCGQDSEDSEDNHNKQDDKQHPHYLCNRRRQGQQRDQPPDKSKYHQINNQINNEIHVFLLSASPNIDGNWISDSSFLFKVLKTLFAW